MKLSWRRSLECIVRLSILRILHDKYKQCFRHTRYQTTTNRHAPLQIITNEPHAKHACSIQAATTPNTHVLIKQAVEARARECLGLSVPSPPAECDRRCPCMRGSVMPAESRTNRALPREAEVQELTARLVAVCIHLSLPLLQRCAAAVVHLVHLLQLHDVKHRVSSIKIKCEDA